MALVSLLSGPMSIRDRAVRVINCCTSEQQAFSETEKNIFSALANQAAVAIVNSELMVKTKVIQEETEQGFPQIHAENRQSGSSASANLMYYDFCSCNLHILC